MMLDPHEAALIRRHLHDPSGEDGFAILSFQERLAHEAPPLGEHVFRLVCELGTDAAKKVAANTKARKEAREALGVNRLPKGEGPDKIVPLSAPTMNEYNGLDPWRKEALRKAYDEEIETRKKGWPSTASRGAERPRASTGSRDYRGCTSGETWADRRA